VKTVYCDEMTEDQKRYSEQAASGKLGDILQLISIEAKRGQAYCNTNNGFLAYGRRLIPSGANRLRLRTPHRCVDFGTDGMIGLLEWTGRQVALQFSAPEFQGTHLLIGDIAAPRGGWLTGRRGRRGHASHTSGQDADVGFLHAKRGAASPMNFDRNFDAATNWWLIKKIFQNPFACVKVIFLDRKLIGKLARVAGDDPEWPQLRSHIRHVKYHKNHMHVRIGDHPGEPGCHIADLDEEIEEEDANEAPDAAEVSLDRSAPARPVASEAPLRGPASVPAPAR
jgi:murein endopeptidase